MTHQVYLGLGTNLGDRRENLQQALVGLASAMQITAVSRVYETEPWGVTDQPLFLNMCVAGITDRSPHQMLIYAKELETELGRLPTEPWGPRLIDIDILFYDDAVVSDEKLTIPHPHIEERAFVLAPLADIAPDLVHPRTGHSVVQMLTVVATTSVRPLAEPLLSPEQND